MMPVVGSTSYASWVPETLHRVIGLSEAITGSIAGPVALERALPFAATDLGVKWRGSGSAPRIKTSSDGDNWTDWRQAHESEDMFDPLTQTHYSDLISGGGARWAQVSPGPGVDQDSLALAVINTADGPLRALRLTRTAIAATNQPDVTTRRAWGADESIRNGAQVFHPIKKIFIHHTVSANNDSDPAATIRAIYAYHVQVRGWQDIGYNFLIDQRGVIYEGRYARPYSAGERPTGEDSSGRGVEGAHTYEHNPGSVGIAMLGTYDSQAPSDAAVNSLVNLVAWEAGHHGINPLGSDTYANASSGAAEQFPNVAGHRDAPTAPSDCPGAKLYPMLPNIRQRAKQTIDSQASSSGGLSNSVQPLLNGPVPGLGDSIGGILKGLGL